MTTEYEIHKQENPAASTATDLYTVPSSTNIVAEISVTNDSASAATFSVWARKGGTTAATKHKIAASESLAANSSKVRKGIALSATDVVTVEASSADLAFTIDGAKVT